MYAEMEFSVKSKTFHTMHKKTCAEWSLYKMKKIVATLVILLSIFVYVLIIILEN